MRSFHVRCARALHLLFQLASYTIIPAPITRGRLLLSFYLSFLPRFIRIYTRAFVLSSSLTRSESAFSRFMYTFSEEREHRPSALSAMLYSVYIYRVSRFYFTQREAKLVWGVESERERENSSELVEFGKSDFNREDLQPAPNKFFRRWFYCVLVASCSYIYSLSLFVSISFFSRDFLSRRV